MNEMCYIYTEYRKSRRKADGIYAEMNRAFCGFQLSISGFQKSVTVTVFGTRPKGV